MNDWLSKLKYNPITVLLESKNTAISYFVKRDLLEEKVPDINIIWNLPELKKILKKQQEDGSWRYNGKKVDIYPPYHYSLVSTFKIYRKLIENYHFNKEHRTCKRASEYIFTCQTSDGDIRGMIGNQYATYYTGYILSLLIKAGYKYDSRVKKGLEWLLKMRQNDGGWTVPILTKKFDKGDVYSLTSEYMLPVEPDFSKPFSHNWTNMVLQAFSEHPDYKNRLEIIKAGELLKSRFFQNDYYNSYKSPYYWIRFAFWWPNILTALDSLYKIGFSRDDPEISLGLKWFTTHQQKDGLWKIENNPSKIEMLNQKNQERKLWLALKICRVLKKYYQN